MVSPQQHHDLVYDLKLSSVGPGRVTGSDVVHDLSGLDLAMKLHNLKAVYLFTSHAAEGLTIMNMKEPMFCWCNDYFMTCGRIRRSEPSGRPYIKCNDCGIRFVEGVCDKTLDEWLEMEDDSRWNSLVYHGAIGPELSFSPLVYLQVTWFKCGGISLGISWAHLLGDAFSVSDFINNWGRCMATLKANGSPTLAPRSQTAVPMPEPLSAKQVNHVGDLWVVANNSKMETFSFNLTTQHLSNLDDDDDHGTRHKPVSAFDSICAVIWRSIAKVREGFEPQVVTVCRKDPNHDNNNNNFLGNTQIIRSIMADFSVVESDLNTLASLIAGDQNQGCDERNMIEAAVEKDKGFTDYIIYGSNLTFVNLVNAGLYEMELKGEKPKFAYYSIQGVGDEGAVLVLPGPPPPPQGSTVENDSERSYLVTLTLPEGEVPKLKTELKRNGLI